MTRLYMAAASMRFSVAARVPRAIFFPLSCFSLFLFFPLHQLWNLMFSFQYSMVESIDVTVTCSYRGGLLPK